MIGEKIQDAIKRFKSFMNKAKCDYCGHKFKVDDLMYSIKSKRLLPPERHHVYLAIRNTKKLCCNNCYKKLYR